MISYICKKIFSFGTPYIKVKSHFLINKQLFYHLPTTTAINNYTKLIIGIKNRFYIGIFFFKFIIMKKFLYKVYGYFPLEFSLVAMITLTFIGNEEKNSLILLFDIIEVGICIKLLLEV